MPHPTTPRPMRQVLEPLVTGVANPAHWEAPGRRRPGRVDADATPAAFQ